jgi:hypothetical protein
MARTRRTGEQDHELRLQIMQEKMPGHEYTDEWLE